MSELDGPRFEPQSGRAPQQLVVLCHGVGADGHDLIGLAPFFARALPDAEFVSPHGPEPHDAFPGGGAGGPRQWFSLADRTPQVMEAGAARAAAPLGRFLDAELARLKLRANDYALIGFSQGAMTALYAGLRRQTPPRAILAYSGALLAPQDLARCNRAPVLLVHGEMDDVVPVTRSQDAERQLRTAQVPVETLYVPRLGHSIDPAGIAAGAAFLRREFGLSG